MKKILSLIMSAVMAVCIFNSTFTALAAAEGSSFNTASAVSLNTIKSVSVSGISDSEIKYWSRFNCIASGYYDFTCSGTAAPEAAVHIIVYDVNKNIINYAVNTALTLSFTATAYLSAGNSYYFCLEYDGVRYDADIVLTLHSHSYDYVQQVKAVGDDDAQGRQDGYVRMVCPSCGLYYDTAVYYSPSAVSLSQGKITYDGNLKYPSVTVYDRAGAVVPASEYTINYEDNLLPGRAFVTVTFNSAIYDGELTKSFIIVPKKQNISSLKAVNSKSLTVKWTKDTAASGYEIQYSTSSKFYKSKTKTVTVTNKNTNSKSISKLQKKKKYYVRIRTYKTIDSVKNYGSWSAVKSVAIKK